MKKLASFLVLLFRFSPFLACLYLGSRLEQDSPFGPLMVVLTVFCFLLAFGKKGIPFAFGWLTLAFSFFGYLNLVVWLIATYGKGASEAEPYSGYAIVAAAIIGLFLVVYLTAFVGKKTFWLAGKLFPDRKE